MPRLLLEPEWWGRARKLKAQGWTNVAIAEYVGKREQAVRNCLDEVYREKNKAKCARQHLDRKSKTGEVYDYKRQSARKEARQRFREQGGDLRKIYRELQCL